jgi:uncharacterized phosphosugar-binding protein
MSYLEMIIGVVQAFGSGHSEAVAMEIAGRAGGLVPTHDLIALTSLEHTTHAEPRHPSRRRLGEIANVVLDNGAPHGDVVLPNWW